VQYSPSVYKAQNGTLCNRDLSFMGLTTLSNEGKEENSDNNAKLDSFYSAGMLTNECYTQNSQSSILLSNGNHLHDAFRDI